MVLRQLDILLYPPAINILLLLLALLVWKKRGLSLSLIVISTFTLLAFSLQITSHQLALRLEQYPAIPPEQLTHTDADAIVVLGGGMVPYASEYGTSSLADDALMRLRYAAHIHRYTGLPLITSGSGPDQADSSEAETMQHMLASDYYIRNVTADANSKTTHENAVNSAAILKTRQMKKIILVTSSLHMKRAVFLFEQQGLEVIPAPTDLYSDNTVDWRYYLPTGDGLRDTRYILHEYLGLLWYRLKYQGP